MEHQSRNSGDVDPHLCIHFKFGRDNHIAGCRKIAFENRKIVLSGAFGLEVLANDNADFALNTVPGFEKTPDIKDAVLNLQN